MFIRPFIHCDKLTMKLLIVKVDVYFTVQKYNKRV